MNKIIAIIIILSTLMFAEDKILWDLGIIIKSVNIENADDNTIKPLISDTHIAPEYKKISNVPNITTYLQIGSLNSEHIINLLYIKNQYFELTQYIDNLQNNGDVLNDQQILTYSDALYRLGNYSQAITAINLLSKDYPLDEKYFTLALYNKKLGEINNAITLLNNLISKYPNSEYVKLAKLQSQILQ